MTKKPYEGFSEVFLTQLAFNWSRLTVETLQQDVKYI